MKLIQLALFQIRTDTQQKNIDDYTWTAIALAVGSILCFILSDVKSLEEWKAAFIILAMLMLIAALYLKVFLYH